MVSCIRIQQIITYLEGHYSSNDCDTRCTVFRYYSHRKEFDRAFVDDADELFFTDTIGGVIPIIKLDKNPVSGGKPGHVTLRLRKH